MKPTQCLLLVSLILCSAAFTSAQEYNTEIQGFYQGYQDLSWKIGNEDVIAPTKLSGGGFEIAQNLAPWFAFWTRFSFYGSVDQPNIRARIFNNLYGIRYQTEQHGPFRIYGKAGLGYSRYSLVLPSISGSDTKFSFAYGAGVQIWMSEHFGAVLDASHTINGLPSFNVEGEEKWDSGLTLSAGLAIRF